MLERRRIVGSHGGRLRLGDLISIDCGGQIDGLWSALGRGFGRIRVGHHRAKSVVGVHHKLHPGCSIVRTPKLKPCSRLQKALNASGIFYSGQFYQNASRIAEALKVGLNNPELVNPRLEHGVHVLNGGIYVSPDRCLEVFVGGVESKTI